VDPQLRIGVPLRFKYTAAGAEFVHQVDVFGGYKRLSGWEFPLVEKI
jgi:hypothetical protein